MATAFNRNEIIAYEIGYRISFDGKILNKNGDVLKGEKDNGYNYIKFRSPDNWRKMIKCKCSRLQAFQKYDNLIYVEGTVVRHLNNDRGDDSWDNIEIGTQSQNCMDNPKEDRQKRGFEASRKILKHSDETVIKIRADYALGMSYRQIGKKYKISPGGTMHHLIHNRIIKNNNNDEPKKQ